MADPAPTPPRVFISYSHDSDEHAARVLAFANSRPARICSSNSRSRTWCGRRSVPRHPRSHRRRRWLGVARGVSAAGVRRREDRRRREAPLRKGPTQKPVHQDTRDPRGCHRDRGDDLRRRAGQRHAAVLDRALPRRGKRLHGGIGAPGRRRAVPRRALGGLDLRQPLGWRDGRQAAAGEAQPARHRGVAAGLQGLSRPDGERSLAAAGKPRRAAAAAAVRQHQHQGQISLRRAVYRGPGRAEHGQHNARGNAAGVRRAWRAGGGDPARRRRCRSRSCRDDESRDRPGRRSQPSCRPMPRRVSSLRGRSCWRRSTRRARC